jgi:hypothetical protein
VIATPAAASSGAAPPTDCSSSSSSSRRASKGMGSGHNYVVIRFCDMLTAEQLYHQTHSEYSSAVIAGCS